MDDFKVYSTVTCGIKGNTLSAKRIKPITSPGQHPPKSSLTKQTNNFTKFLSYSVHVSVGHEINTFSILEKLFSYYTLKLAIFMMHLNVWVYNLIDDSSIC